MSILRDIFAAGGLSLSARNHPHWQENNSIVSKSTKSGEIVTPGNAMTMSAYYAAMRAISEDIGKLPWELYNREPNGNKELARSDPRFFLTNDDPNPETGRMAFKETLQAWALGWGDGHAHIIRDAGGMPSAMWQIHPSRVEVKRVDLDDGSSEIFYEVKIGHNNDRRMLIPAEDMFHLHNVGDDGLTGLSILQLGAESLGVGLATQTFRGAFFGNGTTFGRVFEHPGTLGETGRANLRNSLNEGYQGAGQGFQNVFLEEGMQLSSNNGWISPRDAQLLEESQFNIEEVARWFRMPPHKLQQLTNPTFNTLEQQNQEYNNDTLGPWMERWDAEAERKLLFTRERGTMFWDHDVKMLADFKTRATVSKELIFAGVMEPNEARTEFNMNINNPNGSNLFMQSAMVTLDSIVDGTADTQGTTVQNPNGRPQGTADIVAAHRPIFIDAIERVTNKEAKAVGRASDKYEGDEMATWCVDFFDELQGDLFKALVNPCMLLDGALGSEGSIPVAYALEAFVQTQAINGVDRAKMLHNETITIDEIYNAGLTARLADQAIQAITERYENE